MVVPGEIMMVSMDFVVKPLGLIDLFCFYFLMSVFLNFVDKSSGLV